MITYKYKTPRIDKYLQASKQAKQQMVMALSSSCLLFVGILCILATFSAAHDLKNWWKRGTIYQIYPRSFKDSDGDGVGDIKGIHSQLEYLEELGIVGTWVSPIYKSPMRDFGYDITNHTAIDPLFGTIQDFDSLVKEMKNKGLKMIMDFVPNHTSNESVWFIKSRQRISPYTDYYVWVNGTGPNGTDPPNNWLAMFGGPAWEWCPYRQQFYYHQFIKEQPDLNFHNPHVREEMKNILRFWLDRDVAGFRMDAIKHLFEDPKLRDEPPSNDTTAKQGEYNSLLHIYTTSYPEVLDVVAEWRAVLDEYEKKDGLHRLMGIEINETIPKTVAYYGNDTHPLADIPFNFELFKISNASTAPEIFKYVKDWLDGIPEHKWPNWIIGNHDQPRIANRTDVELVDAFNMLNLLAKGTALTYYGEELGMVDTYVTWEQTRDPPGLFYGPQRYQKFSRDPQRTPMQWNDNKFAGFTKGDETWLPVNPNYKTVNVAKEKADTHSHLATYKRLIQLRKEGSVKEGDVQYPVETENIFSFTRLKPGNPGFVVVINFGKSAETVDLTKSTDIKGFRFPLKGQIVANSDNIKRNSNLYQLNKRVTLNDIHLQSKQAVVIKFYAK